MKIVFMGSPDFAAVSLRELYKSGHEIAAVVTVPDKPAGRGRKLKSSAVKQLALELGLPVLQPLKLKDPSFINSLKNIMADVFVVTAYRILPSEVFTLPPGGTINVHASLLPKYRGAAPINRAIMNGEKETGITIMRIDARVDTGNILFQEKVPIPPLMTAGELHDILALKGARLLLRVLDNLKQIKPQKQEDRLATKAPKLTRETGHINFNLPAGEVFNLIRGLSPHPGAYCLVKQKVLKILLARPLAEMSSEQPPGTVLATERDSFTIACARGAVQVFEVQLQGKKRMPVRDFFNGFSFEKGVVLN